VSELAVAAFAAATESHMLDEPRGRRFERFKGSFDEAAFRRDLEARGFRWVARSDRAFPPLLGSIHDPPPGLFVRGESPLDRLGRPSVAIVGARACSAYGAAVATELGRALAAAGVLVVSGLARGIDAAAHRGALAGATESAAAGGTVAVLGCGIDRDYPRAHAQLALEVAQRGLIVSEYPPGVEPAPWRFPARNRIVAGLTRATVVVEARERSGALITADLALDEGREVLAVPGEITSALSRGTNALLRLGAVPVTGVEDVLEAIGLEPQPAPERRGLEPRLESVLAVVADTAATANEIAARTGQTAGAVAGALAELELIGLVDEGEGVYRASVAAPRAGRRPGPGT
jgi:DNA processing protein